MAMILVLYITLLLGMNVSCMEIDTVCMSCSRPWPHAEIPIMLLSDSEWLNGTLLSAYLHSERHIPNTPSTEPATYAESDTA